MTTTDTRTNYTAGLRALADLLDNRPNLPLPYTGSSSASPITFYALGAGQNPKDVLAQVARMLHGTATKTVSASGDYYSIAGNFYGLHIDATAYRNAVCQRVVMGTHEVTVPATAKIPARPAMPAYVETVEDVQWVCGSLLAEQASS